MFQPSVLSVASAVQEIADCAGASADAEMRNRAFRSLVAGIKYFNGRNKWFWLQTEADPIVVVGPFGFGLTAASGVASATVASGHGVLVDDFIVGQGFRAGTRVSALGGATSLGFNITNTLTGTFQGSATANRDFYDWPSNIKQVYSFRSLGNLRFLKPAQRRYYDQAVADEYAVGVPEAYDVFAHYQRSKVRLLPPPAGADVLQLRHFRRMTVPTASGDTAALDIPQDYDFNLIAWAKWHFLTDKREDGSNQATTWLRLATEGIRTMMTDQTNLPDEAIGFVKGAARPYPARGSTRDLNFEYS